MSYQNQPPPPAGFFPGGYPPQPGYPQQPGYPTGFQPPPPGSGYPPPYGGAPQGGFAPPPPAFHLPPNMSSAESGYSNAEGLGFSDKTIRLGFIRKVYGILMAQIGVTVAIIALFTFDDGVKNYAVKNPGLWWLAFILMFATLITLACCGDVRRKAPMNFICLGIFTVAEGFLLGCISAKYNKEEVFYAALFTFIITVALTMFAFQTKVDFTAMGGILFVAVILLMVFGIVAMFLPASKTVTLVYASLGALLFSVYIIYDTQIMLGGEHKYSISPEEYVFAALNLYMDIVNLFIYILTIIGASRD